MCTRSELTGSLRYPLTGSRSTKHGDDGATDVQHEHTGRGEQEAGVSSERHQVSLLGGGTRSTSCSFRVTLVTNDSPLRLVSGMLVGVGGRSAAGTPVPLTRFGGPS